MLRRFHKRIVRQREVVGCTYAATNYNPDATMDDGSCLLTCTGDLNGDGIIQLTDLLDF